MNKIYAIAAVIALFGTSVLAGDFDATTYTISATSGVMDFSIGGDAEGISTVSTGVSGLAHNLGVLQAHVRGELSYNLGTDAIGVRGEYNVEYVTAVTIYGTAAVEYSTTDASLKGGDWMFEPTVGVSHAFTDSISVYAETAYAWDLSNDWDRLGGRVTAGLDLALTDMLTLTPSISRGYAGASEDWNINVQTAIRF
jgi:opacity protein-like surface antigen